jgi:branched-chain amino acid transport system ATP-binding protein
LEPSEVQDQLAVFATDTVAGTEVLAVDGLYAGYGRKQVVYDVSLHVAGGEVVTLLGHNGSGKTTTIKTILGLFPAQGGRVTYQGRDVTRAGFRSNVRAGMALIPSERFVFPDLTVIDNLLLGGANERDTAMRKERLDRVHDLFPILAERAGQQAGTLSGGQQRMLSLGLLLMAGPKLLMLDEPSLGLAPVIVERIGEVLAEIQATENLAVLLAEQNATWALSLARRGVILDLGRIRMAGEAAALLDDPDVRKAYLGV